MNSLNAGTIPTNELNHSNILVIGGGGFIGSRIVRQLLDEEVASVCVYDNFSRGKMENLVDSKSDDRFSVFPHGGDIRDVDILNEAIQGKDYVFHLAAMWLLHCKDFPRTAFHVNIEGTFNVLEACVRHNVRKLTLF